MNEPRVYDPLELNSIQDEGGMRNVKGKGNLLWLVTCKTSCRLWMTEKENSCALFHCSLDLHCRRSLQLRVKVKKVVIGFEVQLGQRHIIASYK